MKRKKNQMATLITVALLCTLVVFSTVMVGCNKRSEQKNENTEETAQVPEPEEPKEDEKEEEKPEPKPVEPTEEKPAEPSKQPEPPPVPPAAPPNQPTVPSAKPPKPAKPTPPNPNPPKPPAQQRPQLQDIVFEEKGVYSKPLVYRDGSIVNGKITVRNKTFKGDLVIKESVGAGSVTLDNVEVEGTLYVYGGGSHSVNLVDSQINHLVSDRDDHAVRIYAEGDTQVDSVLIKDDTILEEGKISRSHDGFKNVTVKGARGLELELVDLQLNHITTETRCKVDADRRTSITQFNAEAATIITGRGSINKLIASADGVKYETRPNRVVVDHGVDRPTWIDREDDDDDDSSSSHNKDTVRLDAISDQSVSQGSSFTYELTTNASDLYASSNHPDVASVKLERNRLTVTANKVGTSTITVNGTRSGYYSRTIYFTVKVTDNQSNAPKIETAWNNESWVNADPRIQFTVTSANTPVVVEINSARWLPIGNTNQYEFTANMRGKYVVSATDQKGNKAEYTIVVNLDKKAPEITKAVVGTEFNTGSLQGKIVTLHLSDDLSDTVAIEVKRTDDNQTTTQNNHSVNSVYDLNAVYGAEYSVTVIDKAGNRSDPKTIKIEKDTPSVNQPTIGNVTIENKDVWTNANKKVSFVVTAPSNEPVEVSVQKNSNKMMLQGAEKIASVKGTYSFFADANGEYQITASTGKATATHTLTVSNIDKTAPTIKNEKSEEIGKSQKVTFTVEDAESNVKADSVKADGVKATLASGNQYEVTLNLTESKDVILEAQDNVGNTVQKKLHVSVTKQPTAEKKAPVISEITKSPATPTNGAVTLTFTVTDEDTPISQLTVKAEEKFLAVSGGVYTHSVTENGIYTIFAQDASGNKAEKTVEVTNIDKTPPALSVSIASSDRAQAVLSIESSDNVGLASVMADQTPVTLDAGGKAQFIAKENREYVVTAIDQAGNTERKSVTVSGLDKTPPEITVSIQDSDKYTQSKQVTLTVSDSESSIAAVTVDQQALAKNQDGTYSFTATESKTYVVEASDTAGNTAQKSVAVSKADAVRPQPPTLKHGGNIVPSRKEGDSGNLLSYDIGKGTFTVSIQPKQDSGNLVSCEYFVGKQIAEGSVWKTAEKNQLTFLTLENEQEKEYVFFLRTKDLAGNISDAVRYQIIVKQPAT